MQNYFIRLDLFHLPLVCFCSLWLWPRRLWVCSVQGRRSLSVSPRLCGSSLWHVWGELLLQPLHTWLPAVSQLLQPGQRQGKRSSYEHSTFCFITEQTTFNTSDFFFSSVQVNQQRQKLHDLQNLIDNLDNTENTVSDKAFEDRLKEAEKTIMDLLEEAQASKGIVCQYSYFLNISYSFNSNYYHFKYYFK